MLKPRFRPLSPALWAVGAAALLSGCSMIPRYERPAAPVAVQWPQGLAAPFDTGSTGAADMAAWQDFFGDARLRELIALALHNNRDLRVAVLAIEQARAQYQIRSANQFPGVNAAVTAN